MSTARTAFAVMTVALLASSSSARAATLTVGSATAQRSNEAVPICVGLVVGPDELIAGTENVLSWDGNCATLVADSCRANPAHGKEVFGAPQMGSPSSYKVLALSLTDTSPMPAGELYCCDFVAHAEPGGCCLVSVSAPGASDPNGMALPASSGPPGQVCVSADGTPGLSTPTAIITSTPRPPMSPTPTQFPVLTIRPPTTGTVVSGSETRTPTRTPVENEQRTRKPTATAGGFGDGEDDSCAISPTGGASSFWLTIAALLLLSYRRRL